MVTVLPCLQSRAVNPNQVYSYLRHVCSGLEIHTIIILLKPIQLIKCQLKEKICSCQKVKI